MEDPRRWSGASCRDLKRALTRFLYAYGPVLSIIWISGSETGSKGTGFLFP